MFSNGVRWERYSGEGRPEGFADLARGVVNRNPDVIVVANDAIAQAAHAADDAIPIVLITGGDPIRTGQATSHSEDSQER
jgi:ABC-type uncharacterized transport system substrate-binding protein